VVQRLPSMCEALGSIPAPKKKKKKKKTFHQGQIESKKDGLHTLHVNFMFSYWLIQVFAPWIPLDQLGLFSNLVKRDQLLREDNSYLS
jgi:hypothetical protein